MVTRAEIILAAKDTTQAAFAAVSRNFESLSTKATSVGAGMAGIGAAIGGALALVNAKGLIDVLDGLDEMSEKTGVSVEKLSELRYAGETSGTSLEALSSGFSKLSKLMGEAAGGGKEAQSVFQALGVEFKNTDGTLRKQEDVLGDVADKFAGYEDGAGKAALAHKAFGKSGADMLGLLNLGKKGIEDLRLEAQQLGAIYAGDLANDAATFNDNLKKLELASQAASIS
ncbi:MAG: phage tail protein, partial [Variovorax sp.]